MTVPSIPLLHTPVAAAAPRRVLLPLALVLLAIVWGCSGPETPDPEIAPPPTETTRMSEPTDIPAEELDKVALLLSAHEFTASREAFAEATQQPEAALMHLSQDPGRTEAIRLRAFESLALYPSEAVRNAYMTQIRSEGSERIRHRAVTAFATAWPYEAPDVLGTVLREDNDPQIRLTAAVALRSCCGEEGLKLIRDAAQKDTEDWVREKLRGYTLPAAHPTRRPPPQLR
ncbi:MAG: HEAT repeat domain-containing protein [Myxococcota bacterium]